MYLFSYILFLLFNEFWSCFTGTVFPCFRFPGGGPCLPSAYEKQLTPRIDQWLRVEQTGKLKHPVFFVLQNLFQLAIGMIFYSKLIVSIRWFQFSWFGKWLLHQTSNSILGFFRGSRYSTMRIETVEHDLFWVWDIHLKRTGPEEHGFFWWKKIEEPNGGTRKMFVNKSVLFRIFLGSPGKVPQHVEFFFCGRRPLALASIAKALTRRSQNMMQKLFLDMDGECCLPMKLLALNRCHKKSDQKVQSLIFWEWHPWEIGSAYICNASNEVSRERVLDLEKTEHRATQAAFAFHRMDCQRQAGQLRTARKCKSEWLFQGALRHKE